MQYAGMPNPSTDAEPNTESNRGADAEPDVAPYCCTNAEPDAQPHCGADDGAHSGADTSSMSWRPAWLR